MIKISTMFRHDPEVGVKCMVTLGLRASQAATAGVPTTDDRLNAQRHTPPLA